jgi:hypothetical protein
MLCVKLLQCLCAVLRLANRKPPVTCLPDRSLDDHAHRPAVVHYKYIHTAASLKMPFHSNARKSVKGPSSYWFLSTHWTDPFNERKPKIERR